MGVRLVTDFEGALTDFTGGEAREELEAFDLLYELDELEELELEEEEEELPLPPTLIGDAAGDAALETAAGDAADADIFGSTLTGLTGLAHTHYSST